MVTAESAHELARDWIAAWNAHDLDRIMEHYESEVVLVSPVAAQLLGSADGKVAGKENVRRYFQKGLEAFPSLRFKLVEVLWGVSSVVLYYENQSGTRTAEHMEISPSGKISRVAANYSGLATAQPAG
jgi:ketosteroid isomerase-like protein